jgi:GH15 family glucan-1,4-alpha-glucosidase
MATKQHPSSVQGSVKSSVPGDAPSSIRLIEDYALIGDCESAALIGRDGSIDWLCWPRFDSAACFAALLGDPEHGRWQIAPSDSSALLTRRYDPDTLILVTRVECQGGIAEIVDFMPPRDGLSNLVRLVRGISGTVDFRTELVLRFDYGTIVPWVETMDDGTLRAIAGPDMAVLRTTVELRGEHLTTVGDFAVAAGDVVPFVLTYAASVSDLPPVTDAQAALAATRAYWREWSSRCASAGPWTETVRRSLLTLKALTYAPTGGIVAAVTTSLPEQDGGVRNWDYRYCWLRDATFTLLAFGSGGYNDEAAAWRDWLMRAVAGSPDQLRVLYGLGGERRMIEWEASWLPGFNGAKPVRIGNAAATQLQLDIYGEVADAMFQARLHGLPAGERRQGLRELVLAHLEKIWREPDEGLWEVRGPRQHFTHSKVMVWVAFDRAVKSIEQFGDTGPLERWRAVAAEIHDDICRKAFDPALDSFVQSYGSKALDASLLLLPLVGFLPPADPRIVGTVRAVEQRLMSGGLVFRYDTGNVEDGLPPGEGAFLACSFWLADNWILQGRTDEAKRLFGRLVALANDVGLLAEEYDPRSGRQMGNVPQAFSHVALVNTAYNLTRAEGPAEARAQSGSGQPVGV